MPYIGTILIRLCFVTTMHDLTTFTCRDAPDLVKSNPAAAGIELEHTV